MATQVFSPSTSELLYPVLRSAMYLGGVYGATYDRFLVTTDDYQKEACGGVPRHGLLLATRIKPFDIEVGDYAADDEVILLRVSDVARLPDDADIVPMRAEAIRGAAVGQSLDPMSKAATERSGLECKVLGTFYPDVTPGGAPILRWGSDIDTTYGGINYFVYVPGAEALSHIASFPEHTDNEVDGAQHALTIKIGTVRFASTRRRARAAHLDAAEVRVRVQDFVSRKTAILGMTRAGKSNTIKTICSATFEHAQRTNQLVGQLIFDPQGEYANPNEQDGTALRLLGAEWVRVYKLRPDPAKAEERPLNCNFFDPANIEIAHSFCVGAINQMANTGSYTAGFVSATLAPPGTIGDTAERYEMERALFAFYATLAEANFAIPVGWQGITVQMAGSLAAAILKKHPGALRLSNSAGYAHINSKDGLLDTMRFICHGVEQYGKCGGQFPEDSEFRGLGKYLESWARPDRLFGKLREVFMRDGRRPAASKEIERVRDFHNPNAKKQAEVEIIDDLGCGRLVIVDLSQGNERVAKVMADRIAAKVVEYVGNTFRNGEAARTIQVVVEEAHKLFDRSHVNANANDPWVMMAKEAAKYSLGLMFATQQATGVDEQILSETHNWVVAHLNSDKQTNELGHYYDFADFADELRRSEDVGYVRIKTLSSPYTLSVQVDKFDHEMINRARASAGLGPVPAHTPRRDGRA